MKTLSNTNLLTSDLVKRKKEQVFVEGYRINCATDITGGVAADETVSHVYGQDDVLTDINVNNGTLSLTIYDKKDNNVLLDALQENDPNDAQAKQYNWNNVVDTCVWINRKNTANTQYNRSTWYKGWLPVPGMSAGDPGAKGTRTFAGNSAAPREFSQPIIGELLALSSGAGGYTTRLTYSPVQIPEESVYALRVIAMSVTRNPLTHISFISKEDLVVDTTMVLANKNIVIDQADLESVTYPNWVYVNYLYDKASGIHPTIRQHGMYSLDYSGAGT